MWYFKLEDIPAIKNKEWSPHALIIRQERVLPGRQTALHTYKYYTTHEIAMEDVENLEGCLHEVIRDGPQKLRFDIDCATKDLDAFVDIEEDPRVVFESWMSRLMEVIKLQFAKHYPDLLEDHHFVLCDSSNDSKFSRHVIVNGFYVSSGKQADSFCKAVVEHLGDHDLVQFIDKGVYKANQCFRLIGRAKLDAPKRVKKCISEHTDLETLITFTKGCERLDDAFEDAVAVRQVVHQGGSVPDRVYDAFVKAGLESQYTYRADMRVRLMRHSPGVCPLHGVEHQSDNGYLTWNDRGVWFHCYRGIG